MSCWKIDERVLVAFGLVPAKGSFEAERRNVFLVNNWDISTSRGCCVRVYICAWILMSFSFPFTHHWTIHAVDFLISSAKPHTNVDDEERSPRRIPVPIRFGLLVWCRPPTHKDYSMLIFFFWRSWNIKQPFGVPGESTLHIETHNTSFRLIRLSSTRSRCPPRHMCFDCRQDEVKTQFSPEKRPQNDANPSSVMALSSPTFSRLCCVS